MQNDFTNRDMQIYDDIYICDGDDGIVCRGMG